MLIKTQFEGQMQKSENYIEWKFSEQILTVSDSQKPIVAFDPSSLEVADLNGLNLNFEENKSELAESLKSWVDSAQPPNIVYTENKINSLTINVTQICNLHCAYCVAGGDGTYSEPMARIAVSKTLSQMDYFMSHLKPNEIFTVNLLGGEPLLYPEGVEILSQYIQKKALDMGIVAQIGITTNGTLFTEANIQMLRRIRPKIKVSWDGAFDTNDLMRPARGANTNHSAESWQGVIKLMSYKNDFPEVGIAGVFGPHNSAALSAWHFYRELPFDWMEFAYDHVSSTLESQQEFIQNIHSIAEAAYQIGGEAELRRVKIFDYYFERLDSRTAIKNFCGAGRSAVSIDSRNNIYPCPWSVGDRAQKIGSGQSLESAKIATFLDDQVNRPDCNSCWAKNLCGGGCSFIHQSWISSPKSANQGFCQRTKDLISIALVYYQKCRS
jgi:uncharacterized protein